jgi:hypothetical protein
MSKLSRPFTTRRTVLGVPVGRRHTDWAGVRKAAIAGAGALSTAAGGLRVIRRGVPDAVRDLPGQVAGTATKATGQVRKATGQLVGVAADRLSQIAPDGAPPSEGPSERKSAGESRSGRTAPRRTSKASKGSTTSKASRASTTSKPRQRSTSGRTKRS